MFHRNFPVCVTANFLDTSDGSLFFPYIRYFSTFYFNFFPTYFQVKASYKAAILAYFLITLTTLIVSNK